MSRASIFLLIARLKKRAQRAEKGQGAVGQKAAGVSTDPLFNDTEQMA